MKSIRLTSLAVALVLTLGVHPLHAAVNAYLYIDGVSGESIDAQHKGWIEMSSISSASLLQGAADPATRAGLPQIHSFTLTRSSHDKASPKLYEAASKGTHFPEVVIEVRKAGGGGQEYLKYKLTDVMVSGVQASQAGETLTINFAKIELVEGTKPVLASAGVAGALTRPTATATRGKPVAIAPKK
jgi:type VI secretion system secreted protein Hcp